MNISLHNISKRFGQHDVLSGLCLDIGAGSLVSLLGPSGCGKTTLLRIIAGLEVPDRGRVFFDAEDVASWSLSQRKVGFVFQNYAL
ncbi:MAG: ATP-binding cassette domain-containing protein, partial [Oligoflexales bacterium]|nr:ATP-binding cassette domain-containing protein [Oligoflexales bacterium]